MPILVKIGPVVPKKNFFKISSMFRYFVIISPLKGAGSSIWINLTPLHSRMHCAKFRWNWSSSSGEEENWKSLRQQRRQLRRTTDKLWELRKANFSLRLRWAQDYPCCIFYQITGAVNTTWNNEAIRNPLFLNQYIKPNWTLFCSFRRHQTLEYCSV